MRVTVNASPLWEGQDSFELLARRDRASTAASLLNGLLQPLNAMSEGRQEVRLLG